MSTARRTPITPASADAVWRTSSRSQSTNCVEVAVLDSATGAVAVRDSRDRGGTVLVFARAGWAAFIAAVRDGQFDRD
ncbi:MAG TPA: DUF397 domain-containing protein [Micromonosporaceae bacterium]|jgi:Domain of unknown function (DUF397)